MITTEKEWNRAFEYIVPTVSLGVAILSVVLGVRALSRISYTRAGPLGRRIYYRDGQYLVPVRYPFQWHDIREFVQPDNPDVLAVFSQVGADPWALYDFVCHNIDYRNDVGEFWFTPSETLRGHGDCEDSANLLTSLIRAGGMPAYTVLGNYQGYGHAWCEHNGQLMETTFTSARSAPDPENYCPYVLFSDQEVVELWPGALGDIFNLRRDEAIKLNLMARV